MKQTVGLNSHGSFVFMFSIQERQRKVSTSVYGNFSYNTIHVFIHQKTDKTIKELFAIIKNQPIKLQMVVFCCKIRNAIWRYPGFRATTQRHHMGISGIRSKQLRAPYGVSRARWVKLCEEKYGLVAWSLLVGG